MQGSLGIWVSKLAPMWIVDFRTGGPFHTCVQTLRAGCISQGSRRSNWFLPIYADERPINGTMLGYSFIGLHVTRFCCWVKYEFCDMLIPLGNQNVTNRNLMNFESLEKVIEIVCPLTVDSQIKLEQAVLWCSVVDQARSLLCVWWPAIWLGPLCLKFDGIITRFLDHWELEFDFWASYYGSALYFCGSTCIRNENYALFRYLNKSNFLKLS
jgi:hypothetical protein